MLTSEKQIIQRFALLRTYKVTVITLDNEVIMREVMEHCPLNALRGVLDTMSDVPRSITVRLA